MNRSGMQQDELVPLPTVAVSSSGTRTSSLLQVNFIPSLLSQVQK